MIPEYTTVVGVDEGHLKQLAMTWPTWKKNKPSLLKRPMIVFYDRAQVNPRQVRAVVDHPDLTLVPWPFNAEAMHTGTRGDKWTDPQRARMLAGFVYVPAYYVRTPYWFKIDTDAVATPGHDDWIDPTWFKDDPSIVSHGWNFTKPPDQMMVLDDWVERNKRKSAMVSLLGVMKPLNFCPKPGADRVSHKRIISWCAFFETEFTKFCMKAASMTCPPLNLPVHSQDGFVWYVATRMGYNVVRTQMKTRGWQHWLTHGNIKQYSAKAMEG